MAPEKEISRHYDLWSKFYDWTFKPFVVDRQKRAIEQLRLKPGDRMLDMGVGTGMSLEFYPSGVQVVGLDLSGGMLRQAKKKIVENGHPHVSLVQGDATRPPFAEGSFDHVLLSHVISVVPDPHAVLNWAAKLIRPHGRVVMINHFQSTAKTWGAVEKLVNPLCMKLGWRSDVSLARLTGADCPLDVCYQFKLNVIDLWQVVVLKPKPAAPTQTPAPPGPPPHTRRLAAEN